MKYLFFDTETTGIPYTYKKSPLEDKYNWPHIVSICWVLYDPITQKTSPFYYYVLQPNGFTIPPEASAIHGISQSYAFTHGQPAATILQAFCKHAAQADKIIAHNLHFDKNVLLNDLQWFLSSCPTQLPWSAEKEFCTMMDNIETCKIPFANGKPGYKYPKLDELYAHVFGKPAPQDAHNAERDVRVLVEIYKHKYPYQHSHRYNTRSKVQPTK